MFLFIWLLGRDATGVSRSASTYRNYMKLFAHLLYLRQPIALRTWDMVSLKAQMGLPILVYFLHHSLGKYRLIIAKTPCGKVKNGCHGVWCLQVTAEHSMFSSTASELWKKMPRSQHELRSKDPWRFVFGGRPVKLAHIFEVFPLASLGVPREFI